MFRCTELKTSTPDDMLVSLRTPQDADRTYIDLKVAIACTGADHEWLAEWGQLDSTINTISPLIRRAQFIFGFRGQIAMNRFAEDVPSKIPSISRIATIRYSLRGKNGGWCRALPGSGVLQGMYFVFLYIRGADSSLCTISRKKHEPSGRYLRMMHSNIAI